MQLTNILHKTREAL